jgi:hypothetical protein
MTVTVYHWTGGVGHVALEVVSGKEVRYISWYPEVTKESGNLLGAASALIAAKPAGQTKALDLKKKGVAPNIVIIEGLDEGAMISFIDQPRPYYSLFGTSCAQVVADTLRAGIGGKYNAGIMNLNPVWTPLDATNFARRIRSMYPKK